MLRPFDVEEGEIRCSGEQKGFLEFPAIMMIFRFSLSLPHSHTLSLSLSLFLSFGVRVVMRDPKGG